MRLGFFAMPLHPKERNYTETLKEDRELTLLADQLGFEEGFFGLFDVTITEVII